MPSSCLHERGHPTCSCHHSSWFTEPGSRLRSGHSPSLHRSPNTTCPPCDRSQGASNETSQVGYPNPPPRQASNPQTTTTSAAACARYKPATERWCAARYVAGRFPHRKTEAPVCRPSSTSSTAKHRTGIDTTRDPPKGEPPPLGAAHTTQVAPSASTRGGCRRQLGATFVTPRRRTEVATRTRERAQGSHELHVAKRHRCPAPK